MTNRKNVKGKKIIKPIKTIPEFPKIADDQREIAIQEEAARLHREAVMHIQEKINPID